MNIKKVQNQMLEIEYKEKENAEVLDCTKEIEEYIKEVLSE